MLRTRRSRSLRSRSCRGRRPVWDQGAGGRDVEEKVLHAQPAAAHTAQRGGHPPRARPAAQPPRCPEVKRPHARTSLCRSPAPGGAPSLQHAVPLPPPAAALSPALMHAAPQSVPGFQTAPCVYGHATFATCGVASKGPGASSARGPALQQPPARVSFCCCSLTPSPGGQPGRPAPSLPSPP